VIICYGRILSDNNGKTWKYQVIMNDNDGKLSDSYES
jgi:hypothetical protein